MAIKTNLFLIGSMGAGKSSIGRQLARRLKRPFLDSDKLLEERTGVDIPTIFEYEGESGFRLRETAVLEELTQEQGIVLATGGGAVLKEENRRWLRSRGFVIYLAVSVDTQLERTSHDHHRPLLTTADPRTRLESLAHQREPLYRELANMTVDANKHNIHRIVKQIVSELYESGIT